MLPRDSKTDEHRSLGLLFRFDLRFGSCATFDTANSYSFQPATSEERIQVIQKNVKVSVFLAGFGRAA